MTLEMMKEMKRELGLTNEMIAQASGIPLGTVQKVFSGTTRTPRMATRRALEDVLVREQSKTHPYQVTDRRIFLDNVDPSAKRPDMVSEPPAAYGATVPAGQKRGSCTLEDYYALPDDRRVELIDGIIYEMSSPTGFHQIIAAELYSQIRAFIRSEKGSCMPFISPIDVRLDRDDKTIVQPDVIILCDKDKYTPRRIEGAPDFIAEVLSPSTRAKDLFIKLNKYRSAGVREYWIIDPEKKSVMTYLFEGNDDYAYYTFRDQVPVAIYSGKLIIDFSQIDDVVSGWM